MGQGFGHDSCRWLLGSPGSLLRAFALQGLLSPPSLYLTATVITRTQPQTVSSYSCFIHLLLSPAILEKLLPNYAALFFFLPIINFFSRVESFPDHPPPTYTHACTHTHFIESVYLCGGNSLKGK